MIPDSVVAEMRCVALQRYPHEAVMAYWADGSWQEFANVHSKPKGAWMVSEADEAHLEANPPLVLVHSHPSGCAEPSDLDTLQQIKSGYVWAVMAVQGDGTTPDSCGELNYWGDGAPHAPLLGRTYLWGVRDCYTVVQAFFAQHGIHIPAVPRIRNALSYPPSHKWAFDPFGYWIGKQGLWREIDAWDAEPGDVLTYRLSHHFHDHCAVVLGEGKYLEQRGDRLSGVRFHLSSYLEQRGARYYRLKGYNAKDRASWRIEGALS